MKIVIRVNEIGPSNNAWDKLHYGQKTKIKHRWYWLVKEAVVRDGLGPIPLEAYPVRITLVSYFGKGKIMYDWVNLGRTAKLFEDGLRNAGVLRQDSKKFVSYGTLVPEADRTHPTGYSVLTLVSL